MKVFDFLLLALFSLLACTANAAISTHPELEFDVLCYHDVRDKVDGDLDRDSGAVSTKNLARHFAWIKAHGYQPISIDDLLAAKAGKKPLPKKAIMLTFDDGYKSFYTRIYPLLKLYQYPAVYALVGSWLEVEPGGKVKYGNEDVPREKFLTNAQIKEMANSGLIEFASHSYDMHQGVLANPQGSIQPSVIALAYDPITQQYETRAEHRKRVKQDLSKNSALIKKLTGKAPRVMVWPYGAYNKLAKDVAAEVGMPMTMTLEDSHRASIKDLSRIGRHLVDGNPSEKMIAEIALHKPPLDRQRVMHIDLDYLYDPDPAQINKNFDKLIDRVYALAPTTVYLQAYADANGDGVAEGLYFPNRHVEMRADLFNRVAWQLKTRAGVEVYGWMPILAFELKDKEKQKALQVVSAKPEFDQDNYKRLSPFSKEAREIIKEIYHDFGVDAFMHGVLFHDDGMLSEFEDDSVFAREVYQKELGFSGGVLEINKDPQRASKLAAFKTQYITDLTLELAAELKEYQAEIKTARNLYAAAVLNPESERWLGQNYQNFLDSYDYTGLMAMPFMENAKNPDAWLQQLLQKVKENPSGLSKTIFELQAKDWRQKKAIDESVLAGQMQLLLDAGAHHVGYYPDDFIQEHPAREVIRPYISSRSFPYIH